MAKSGADHSGRGGKHRDHALDKASATHLHNRGHITEDQRDEIVAHADRHIKKVRGKKD